MDGQLNLFDQNADYFEVQTDDLNLQKLNFKVHASIIYKLGESLIADEVTALSELLKNSYDADASFCNLTVESDHMEAGKVGRITISDNGCGMDLQTIVSGWLTISNSPKKKMKKNNETTGKYNRIPLGDKGLGRLSVQKLGRKVVMVTKQANSMSEYTITIPWDEFLKNTTLDRIDITCHENIVNNNNSYTKIIITDLIDPSYWSNEGNVKNLETTIGKIISPFRFRESNFVISATVDKYKIDVSNAIFNDVLNTARCIYSFKVIGDSILLNCKYKLNFFKRRWAGNQYQDFDFQRDYFLEMYEQNMGSLDGWNYFSEGETIFEIDTFIPLDSRASLIRSSNTGLLYHPGEFDGEIFDFYYDKNYVEELISSYSLTNAFNEGEYVKYIKKNKGIKVIRDGFVVQGYSDGNFDWLNLSSSPTTSGKYGDINNESIIGYVKLTGKNNQNLKETTSREGFIDDEYYKNFYTILRDIVIKKINQHNQSLSKIFTKYLERMFNQNEERQNPTEQISNITAKATDISKRIFKEISSNQTNIAKRMEETRTKFNQFTLIDNQPEQVQSEYELIIKEQGDTILKLQKEFNSYLMEVESAQNEIRQIQNLLDNYYKRIGDVFELAGLGISVELFTHELYTTINNVNEKIKNLSPQSEEVRYVFNAMNSLRKQISYFHPGLKYIRLKKEVRTISSLIEEHISFYEAKAKSQDIEQRFVKYSGELRIEMNIGLFNQVLDNLFSNSYYWLQYSRDNLKVINHCVYTIEQLSDYTINIWDNGIGISKDIEKELFNPFVSCKEDGRGLGLFICMNNLENSSASIRLLRERNNFGNLYKFHIDLSNLKR